MVSIGFAQPVRNCPALRPEAASRPNTPFSITMTSSPRVTAASAALRPDRPPPTTSNWQVRFAFGHEGGEKPRTSSS